MGMNRNYSTISNLEPWFFPEFVLPFDAYKIKPWIIPIKLLLSNIYYENDISQNQNENDINSVKIEFQNSNQEKEGQSNLVSDPQKQNQKEYPEEDCTRSNIKKGKKKKNPRKIRKEN
ncbi:hypothetical protein C4D60_Mb00t05790 [Musa balbisiana]|uniref:Translocon at the inner envelope membrane of chloroplasts 214 n=1 Tax=Musa balbisiana TaxID=52838 RepID=A0A4S8I8F5_MUSBA|nr:hypothetical protein C4D60_Mb00t05790 [Musa balbisiana]